MKSVARVPNYIGERTVRKKFVRKEDRAQPAGDSACA